MNWWNLIFVLPFGLALLYLGLYTLTGVTFGDADADAGSADAAADADADAEADAEAAGDAETESDGGSGETEAADDHGHAPLHAALAAALGLGRVPLSLVLMVLMMTWGLIGFAANSLLQPALGAGARVAWASVPAAAVGSLLVTQVVVRLIGRLLPMNQTFARRRHELLGFSGEAVYAVDEQFGMAAVRDERGNFYQVPCRVEPGRASIAKGGKVLLVGYNAKHKIFHVIPDGSSAGPETVTS